MLFYGKYGLIVRYKDIAFIYNKRVIKFDFRPITDKYYNSVSEF